MAIQWYAGNDMGCLSSDSKPSAPNGSRLVETDTGNQFLRLNDAWVGVSRSFSPGGCPPSIIYKDADEIYLPKGRYPQAGFRFNGQYQGIDRINFYWDLSDRTAIDIDATYSAGTTSGMIGGAKVNSSWYSVFMVGQGLVVVLPFVRVDTITYSAPNTVITPAAHADGTTAADGFIVANDAWNDYRLVLINDDPTLSGNIYTIVDSATGTPDQILVSGDVTSQIAATQWMQLVPPANVPCLYLGTIKIDSSGNLAQFIKSGWSYKRATMPYITAIANTSPGNTDLGLEVPPTAKILYSTALVSSDSTVATRVQMRIFWGIAGTDVLDTIYPPPSTATDYFLFWNPTRIQLTATSLIRNSCQMYTGSWVAAGFGRFYINGYEE